MPKPSVLPVVCVLLAAGAALANRTISRLSTVILRPAPIAAFPSTLCGWTCVAEKSADTPVLPTAHIIERTWQDAEGHSIQSLLLTARDYSDFHDPNVCLPLQGFSLSPLRVVRLPDTCQDAFLLTATRGSNCQQVLYWWPGQPTLRSGEGRDQWGKLLALRDRLTGEPGHSLFVRLICPAGAGSENRLIRTAADWEPSLDHCATDSRRPLDRPEKSCRNCLP